ncbi:hypothetical protein [Lacisediminihabitans changchengi]|uniref:O-antigen ligase family protein n=1 Tax=Lacisediminihabitans changchengi TaxID=2787634 RepID=A0A934SGV8_9MICO|nr:hypothetical protein [Lacisediminihabitans changchengi]MBK4346447.1 hypothetical protein [Lacisediminihabitans changchengi]MBK4348925.1 hypothetical protein [Lacisediminihabitans changchengi]
MQNPISAIISRIHQAGACIYGRKGFARVERILSIVAAATIFLPSPVATRLTVGTIIAIVCFPFAARQFASNRPARWVLWATFAIVPVALVTALVSLSLPSGREWNTNSLIQRLLEYVAFVGAMVACGWCAKVNGIQVTGIVLGTFGALFSIVFITSAQAENPWKYVLAWPLSLLFASLLARAPLLISVVSMLGLAYVSFAFESRNAAGALVLAAVLAVIIKRRKRGLSPGRVVAFGGAIVLTCAAVFIALTSMVSAGLFGHVLQSRQSSQGAIGLLAGRIEPLALLGYFKNSPLGVGIGVVPSRTDRAAAIHELSAGANFKNLNTDYIYERLVGERVDLHSIVGTFWYDAGLIGLVIGLFLIFVVGRGILATRTNYVVIAFAAVQGLWDLLFSPLGANGRWVGIALALVLVASAEKFSGSPELREPAGIQT